MTMNANVPDTFLKTIQLSIETETGQSFTLQAHEQNGTPILVTEWLTFLFFQYEPAFYGLTANHSSFHVTLSPLEMVELFSEEQKHPFITYVGIDENASHWLEAAFHSSTYWYSKDLWQHIQIDNDAFILDLPIDELTEKLLQMALIQKLLEAGLTIHDIPPLLPFFRNGGWPIQSKIVDDEIYVGLRLREPAEDQDEWFLETVVRNKKSSTYWTPPMRKRKLPIDYALPEKWKHHVEGIKQLQQQIIELLHTSDYMEDTDPNYFLSLHLKDPDVREFLRTDFVRLQALGFEIVLPAWLKNIKDSRIKVRASAGTASNYKSAAGLQEILTFDWKLSLNGQDISIEEFQQMVNDSREFIRAGTEWVKVDAAWMQEIRQLMDKAENENWTIRDLLFQELPEELTAPIEEENDEDRDDPFFQFEMQKSLRDYVQTLVDKKGMPAIKVSDHLKASLRPYQQEGFEWLVFMRGQSFGACLADDMGLGKTVQLISYLLHVYDAEIDAPPTLIICPTSVLGNWQKELERFAPSLKVYLHYGSNRLKDENFDAYLHKEKPQVVLSTYGTITQDIDMLEHRSWTNITLDEAQNIKNMHTKQSKAIRRLHGKHHIALTGTPVENRLSELWAIFDFIYRGYLGSFSRFQEEFIAPIERDDSENHKIRLRKKIQPFLLRRTKQNPALMLNLPDKLEQREYCPLTEEQAVLYESFIQETLQKLKTLSGFERKGLILKMLSKLKQLCNHPALYLKEPFEGAEEMLKRSEKLDRIVTLAADIANNQEQCLIFTQYIGMGHLLQHCFSELYDIDAPFLTGSMPKQQRDYFVESFQKGEFPIFILSLKAGGTGLNLTAANHVLHADRWWNPAVENQATDRAYRIGQTQFVHVHKFITTGTIEEKIDTLLSEKQALSEELIQSSQWITELKDEEIMDLLSFSF